MSEKRDFHTRVEQKIVICTSYQSHTSFMNLQFNQANE
jgi:hypothetical protein